MNHIPGTLAAPDLSPLGLAFVGAILLVAAFVVAYHLLGSHR